MRRRKQLGLGPDVELLPDSEEDAQGAALAFFAHGRSDEAAKKQANCLCAHTLCKTIRQCEADLKQMNKPVIMA
eukprot:1148591-Pelagomonas_calceolata.AAC.1